MLADLPVGLVAEPSALVVSARLILGAAAVFLLAAGSRAPRTAAAVLAALAALPFAAPLLRVAVPLVAAAAWALAALAGHAVLRAHPRVGAAVLGAGAGAAAYLAVIQASGAPGRGLALALVAGAGAVAGVLRPGPGWALGTTAAGTAAVAAASGSTLPLPALGTLWLAAAAAQLGLPAARGGPAGGGAVPELGRVAAGLLAFALGAPLAAIVTAPAPHPLPGRLARLEAADARLPALVLSAPAAAWLTGRALPVAVAGGRGLAGRLPALLHPPVDGAVHRLRAVKDPGEIAALRRAAAATTAAMARAAAMVRPGVRESEIAAAVEAACREQGAGALAFPTIVAAGPHAALPHWDRNDGTLARGLVVIDLGCRVDGYAADMTRTFVVAPPPAPHERELLELVAAARAAAEAELRPGSTLGRIQRAARAVFERAGMERYFVHAVGHHVGIEVHDPGPSRLEPGMVVALEPGLYVAAGSPAAPAHWNLGVRIEDTYLITEQGWERLTGGPLLTPQSRSSSVQ